MFNKELYFTEPTPTSILNDGVVDVVAGKNEVLKYELRTFVCEGKYEEGLTKVLKNFCDNFGKETMPAVWISGFYGSGKSHLIKMLAQLWENTPLPDGSRPRDLVNLPQQVNELLAELNTLGKQNGGLHAATGTLHGENTDDMKMAILKTVFRSKGLPESYSQAKFVLWLREQGKESEIREKVEAQGGDWYKELRDLNVSRKIHKALCETFNDLFPSPKECGMILIKQFPAEKSVSDTDFGITLREALQVNGKIPLTMVVMDEVQQYIGSNDDRVATVQSAVQACSKAMNGRIMLVATGQSALSGTTMLNKIKDRFVVEIQLQDMDITSVIRNVILRKKPDVKEDIEKTLIANIGEISKHLAGTPFVYKPDVDKNYLAADYPILPSRRRFWEKVLLALDVNGTDGQLRNQLKMTRDFAFENGERKIGHVVEADKLFFWVATRLQNNGIMSQEFFTDVMTLKKSGDASKRLAARACGLVFLVNKLADHNRSLGLKATADVLADLMVMDLNEGSAELRKKLPGILDECPVLQKLGDCYRVQTKESSEWAQQFKAEVSALKSSGAAEVDTFRMQQINAAWSELGVKPTISQGKSKQSRDVQLFMNKSVPESAKNQIALVVANDWYLPQKDVKAAAAAAGMESAHVWVYVPKAGGDEFRNHLIDLIAAEKTIAKRPTPSTQDGIDAKGAIESKRLHAAACIRDLVAEMFKNATVYQGGGVEVTEADDLPGRIRFAATVAAERLYKEFAPADDVNWGAVWTAAHKGDPDSLSAVGHAGDVKNHPIAAKILSSLGTGKKGDEIRKALMAAPYGWTKDAIDGSLGALLVSGEIVARGADGKLIEPKKIERKQMGFVEFRIEAPVLTITQQIKLCKFFQSVIGQSVKKEELAFVASAVLDGIEAIAASAGGEAPRPEKPDTAFVDNLRALSGNELLVELHAQISDIETKLNVWKATAAKISERIGAWTVLEKLAANAVSLSAASALLQQVNAIRSGRQLLDDPDTVPFVSHNVESVLKKELEGLKSSFAEAVKKGESELDGDANWNKLPPETKHSLREKAGILEMDLPVATSSTMDILNTFAQYTVDALRDKVDAHTSKYGKALLAAAKEVEPKIQNFAYPHKVLKTEADVDAFVADIANQMKAMLPDGPVQS